MLYVKNVKYVYGTGFIYVWLNLRSAVFLYSERIHYNQLLNIPVNIGWSVTMHTSPILQFYMSHYMYWVKTEISKNTL